MWKCKHLEGCIASMVKVKGEEVTIEDMDGEIRNYVYVDHNHYDTAECIGCHEEAQWVREEE